MKHNLEFSVGMIIAATTWLFAHYNAIAAGVLTTVAIVVWVLRARREWKHRNDKPENE